LHTKSLLISDASKSETVGIVGIGVGASLVVVGKLVGQFGSRLLSINS
jgi:hypothetical protein